MSASTKDVAQSPPPGEAREAASSVPAPPKIRTWPAVAMSMLVTAAVLTMLFVRNHRYFFIDDRQADGVAKLVDLGRILLSGEWPWLSTSVVNSGGYAVEYQNGVFNPANLLLGMLMSRFTDAAAASFLQILVHTLVLAGAAAWLARLLGLTTAWTLAFAASVSLQPYTIFWVAGWYQVVTSFSWFVLAAAAALAFHLRPRLRYGWTLLVATYSCYTSGWPLAIPVLALFVLTLVITRLVTRQPRRGTSWLSAWYAGGALASLVALYPLFVSFQFATRSSAVANTDNFNVVPVEGLLHFADPTYWPWFNNFGGYGLQTLPHFYVAWFVLPVLVLWRQRPMDPATRAVWITAVTLLAVTVLGALGPERLLVFRFPSRFAQYSGFFLLVVAALLVAHGRAAFSRRRLGILLACLGALLVNSLQSDPLGARRILPLGVVVAALCVGVWWAGIPRTGGAWARRLARVRPALRLDRVVTGGTVLVLVWLAYVHPIGRGLDWGFPHDLSMAPRLSQQDYTLFYGNYPALRNPDKLPSPREDPSVQEFYREYHASSMGLMVGDRQVNGYSPLGYRSFRERFPIDDQGNFGESGAQMFTAVDPETGRPWLEMLRVDQVIAQLGPRDEQLRGLLTSPWRRVSQGKATATYRHPAYTLPGLVSYVSPGTRATTVDDCPRRESTECVQVQAPSSAAARVVFARLWFPGYSASLDGDVVPVVRHGDMLVSVDVPAGRSGRLVISYRSPGFVPLASVAALVVVGLGAASILLPVNGRRRRIRTRARSAR